MPTRIHRCWEQELHVQPCLHAYTDVENRICTYSHAHMHAQALRAGIARTATPARTSVKVFQGEAPNVQAASSSSTCISCTGHINKICSGSNQPTSAAQTLTPDPTEAGPCCPFARLWPESARLCSFVTRERTLALFCTAGGFTSRAVGKLTNVCWHLHLSTKLWMTKLMQACTSVPQQASRWFKQMPAAGPYIPCPYSMRTPQ